MKFPISTGQGAQFLGVTEPQLAETIRRGKVAPPPQVFAGRRLWYAEHLLQAAGALDILTDGLKSQIEASAHAHGVEVQP